MWLSQALAIIPPIILVPYLLGTIGEVGYGIYALIWSLIMSIDQLEKSLQSGVVKYSAAFLAQGLTNEVNKIISSSFVYSLILAIIASVAIIITAKFYNEPSGQLGVALIIIGIMILFIVPLTPYISVIQSKQLYYINAIADSLSKYVSLLAIVIWFSVVNPSVEALIIITALMLFIARVVQVPIAYRLVPGMQNNLQFFNKESFRLIFSFGAATVLASTCLAVNTTGIRWLMDALASTSFVAHLAIMLMPVMLLSQIIGALTITVMPATSAYEATGKEKMLKELLIRGMRYINTIVLAAIFIAGILMRDVLILWVGHDYTFLAPFAVALFASRAFMLSTGVSHHILKGIGKLKTVVFIYLIGLVIVPIGLIIAIFSVWNNPYIAVTTGLTVGYIICGFLQIGYGAKAVHAEKRNLFMRAYAQPLIVAGIVFLIAYGIMHTCKIDGIVGHTIVAALATLLFFVGCYAFISATSERTQVIELIQFAKKRISKSFN
jgi:O-antigen/teichoic acid export membrane protein